jgi:hypothetical protein
MNTTRPWLAALVVAAVAPVVAAQSGEQAALAHLKAQAKVALKELKADVAQHIAALDGRLEEIRTAIEDGAFDTAFVLSLAPALRDEQTEAYWDISAVAGWMAFATVDAVALLPEATPDGIWPPGLYVAANDVIARTCRKARTVVENSWGSLAKRAAKVEAFAREHGIGLSIQFLPPDPQNPWIVGNEDDVSLFPEPASALLVLLAWSDLDVQGDGRVLVAGMPPVTASGTVDVVIHNGSSEGVVTQTKTVPILAAEPFDALLDGVGELLAEGNWVVKLQAGDMGFCFGAFGIP